MIGARQVAGSTISNGGDSSPLNWVIVGRCPWNPLLWSRHYRRKKRSFYEYALSIITIVLPSEKILEPAGTYPGPGKRPALIDLRRIPVQNSSAKRLLRSVTFTRNLPSVGLSERIDPLIGIRRPPRHAQDPPCRR